MIQEDESNSSSLITTEQIFIAYAEMKANSSPDAFSKIRAYYRKRWRLISTLFEIRVEENHLEPIPESYLLKGLASHWWSASHFSPLNTPYIGRHEEPDRSIAASHYDSLARKAASMRSEYRQMGGELIRKRFPEILGKRIAISRLQELGLPAKKPNATEECLKAWDRNFEEEEGVEETVSHPLPDNLSRERMDELKRAEEVRARAEASLAREVAKVRKLALEQGVASEEEIDGVIYNMALSDFLKLSASYPRVSRTHFNPALKSPSK
jgi:hypothetical protein